ncbi:MAG: ferritin family protein [Desulfobacterales bacterium]|nr:ferritin family protein [Desulfobacterales bacterium]
MGYEFDAAEIFEMAEQMERNGAKFYRTASENISDPAAKKMLSDLAAMEDEHEKTFASLRAKLTDKKQEDAIFGPQNEAILYLRAIVDTRVFFEKQIDITSMQEILKAAIKAEKDSIVFYLGIKASITDDLSIKSLDEIIQEEMRHVTVLSNKLLAPTK